MFIQTIRKWRKKILAIPATQFESERNFSANGRTLKSRRNRLSPENIDHLLFIRKNLKIKFIVFENLYFSIRFN